MWGTMQNCELVLEGGDLADLEGMDPTDIDIDSGTLAAVGVIPPERDVLAQVALHLPWETIAAVIAGPIAKASEQWRDAVREAQEQTMREARQIMQERIRSALAEMEGETE